MRGVFITAIDTGVGKTFLGITITKILTKKGIIVHVRKPVESGYQPQLIHQFEDDATLLQQAADEYEPLTTVCPWRLSAPISPERAGIIAGIYLTLTDLVNACYQEVKSKNFLLVEGAGGFLSPLAPRVLNADLAVALGLPLILVVADRLGCINHTLLTIEAINRRRLKLAAVFLNQYDNQTNIHGMDNATDLSNWLGSKIFRITDINELVDIINTI